MKLATDEGRAALNECVSYMMKAYATMATDPDALVFQANSAMACFTPFEVVQMLITAMHLANGHSVTDAKPKEPQPHSISEAGQRELADPRNELGLDMMVIGYRTHRSRAVPQDERMKASRIAFEQAHFDRKDLYDMLVIAIERLTDT